MVARLFTGTGAYVGSVEIPPFTTGYPPILVWGVRTFLRVGDERNGEYAETFAYAIPDDAVIVEDRTHIGATHHEST
jgi:hypothetical protein